MDADKEIDRRLVVFNVQLQLIGTMPLRKASQDFRGASFLVLHFVEHSHTFNVSAGVERYARISVPHICNNLHVQIVM